MSDFLQVSVPIVVSGIYLYALLESTVAELGTTKFLREKLIKKQVDVTTTRQQPSSCCHEKQTECSICLEAYKPAETIACTKACGHQFHSKCLRQWLLAHDQCPMCRTEVIYTSTKRRTSLSVRRSIDYWFPASVINTAKVVDG